MLRTTVTLRTVLGFAAFLLGSLVATEVFAWQHGWHVNLGTPLYRWQAFALYRPWSIWGWAWLWLRDAPGHFSLPGLAGLATVALVALPLRQQDTPKKTVSPTGPPVENCARPGSMPQKG